MEPSLEPAASGRSKCRGCGGGIPKGELRLGERLPNPFADEGELTLWFHPACAALKRPEAFLEAVDLHRDAAGTLEDLAGLREEAERGRTLRRLPRVAGAERATSGRARCRGCKEPIAKGAWRLRLVFFEEGRFHPSGFAHAACAGAYFETTQLLGRLRRLSPELDGSALGELAAEGLS